MTTDQWPELALASWEETYATLHRWLQIVGKIRLSRTPWINHSWHVPLYVTARGLTTSPISHGKKVFQIDFDFVDHELLVQVSDGQRRSMPLREQSVALFHTRLFDLLEEMRLDVSIHGSPNEVEDATPFAEDRKHVAYDPAATQRFWQILVQVDRVFKQFRSRFTGKCSPVHFFWGSFDLAVTRFSGRRAPRHPGGIPNMPDHIVQEAYSHEVSSCGFWPGGAPHRFPLFYSYAYPEPHGFAEAPIDVEGAFYSTDLLEWVLPYDAVRDAARPDEHLLDFLQQTYDVAAGLGRWKRDELERAPTMEIEISPRSENS